MNRLPTSFSTKGNSKRTKRWVSTSERRQSRRSHSKVLPRSLRSLNSQGASKGFGTLKKKRKPRKRRLRPKHNASLPAKAKRFASIVIDKFNCNTVVKLIGGVNRAETASGSRVTMGE